jgi:hypothetical protein
MRVYLIRWAAIIFLVFVVGCRATLAPTPLPDATFSPSPKGWELYSWKKQDNWFFVLVNGTNRIKTAGEILTNEGAVINAAGIRNELARLPRGEEVVWALRGMPEFGFPPADMIQEIQAFCTEQGIKLTVIPQR